MKYLVSRASFSFLIAALTLAASFPASAQGRMSARAQEVLEKHPHEMIDLIVTYRQRPGADDRAKVKDNGGELRHEFKLIPGHAIRIPVHAATALEHNPNVARISYDEPVSGAALATLQDGLYTVNGLSLKAVASLPSSVRAALPELDAVPYTGAGVKVAVLDSGFKKHGDLSPLHTLSLVGKNGDDTYGHGNHVATIISGNGNGSGGSYRGVAADAEVIAVRVLNVVVQSPAFFAVRGTPDDQFRNRGDIAKFDQIGDHFEIPIIFLDFFYDILYSSLRSFQPFIGAHDADVIPHQASDFIPVVRHHDHLIAVGGAGFVPVRCFRGGSKISIPQFIDGCASRVLGIHQGLEQRVAGQAVGTMQAGASGFTNGV